MSKPEYVYSLTLYNKNLYRLTNIPLFNRTNQNYEIPNDVSLAVINAYHLTRKEKKLTNKSYRSAQYDLSNIYYLFVDDDLKICYDKEDDFYYLLNENQYCYEISNNYKTLRNNQELKQNIENIIKFFNNADLTSINNNQEFYKNEFAKEFEKKLIKKLKY